MFNCVPFYCKYEIEKKLIQVSIICVVVSLYFCCQDEDGDRESSNSMTVARVTCVRGLVPIIPFIIFCFSPLYQISF